MLKAVVEAINGIQSNILGFLLVLAGVGVNWHNSSDTIGREMIVGGFALINGGQLKSVLAPSSKPLEVPNVTPATPADKV